MNLIVKGKDSKMMTVGEIQRAERLIHAINKLTESVDKLVEVLTNK